MKQTIVAILNSNLYQSRESIERMNNKQFIEDTEEHGNILTLQEFEKAFNDEELDFNTVIIRFIEAELEVKAVK